MTQARVSEIFLSYQGEGPYAGSRQLFVRFYGCDLNCGYCDTRPDSYKSFTREALLSKVIDFGDDYNELVLTGGEPLLYADLIAGFLPLFRKNRDHRFYLETNGTMSRELEKVIDQVDIISMDIKLPSTDPGGPDLMERHSRFIRSASRKELIVKAVISDTTVMGDIKRMTGILPQGVNAPRVVLQPVTPGAHGLCRPDHEMLDYFKRYIAKQSGCDVMVLGQMHRYLDVR
jgi:organic radical activating enzyme